MRWSNPGDPPEDTSRGMALATLLKDKTHKVEQTFQEDNKHEVERPWRLFQKSKHTNRSGSSNPPQGQDKGNDLLEGQGT